jgi:hypothetical protein
MGFNSGFKGLTMNFFGLSISLCMWEFYAFVAVIYDGGGYSGIVPMGKGPLCPLDKRANGCRKSFRREKNITSCWESNSHLVPWLRTSGPILLLPLYAFIAFNFN